MSIDINATDFMPNFKLADATIGVVGHGFVGKAVEAFFKETCNTILVNDKAEPESTPLRDIVARAEVIFVCVPTPMRRDGSCYTGFIEEVIKNIKDLARELNRNLDSFVTVVKSTVYPGFLEDMQEMHLPMRLTFSPEFLTEANSVDDFKKTNRIIVGGDEDDAMIVLKYFADADVKRVEDGRRILLQCDPTTAEMVKLYANGILTAKVIFSNEIYQMCQKLGIDYNEVKSLAVLDTRIGAGHTTVPGPDGQLGYGGHCFPKDVQNLRASAKLLGVNEKMFTAMIERNDELREKKDWLEMRERAVTEN